MSYSAYVSLGASKSAGVVRPELFGANFIVSKDSFDGTYQGRVDGLNVSHIRFPGGEVSEKYFNLLDPDDMPVSETGTVDGLSRYVAFANERDLPLQIVIPTKKYADDPMRGVSELGTFIERLEAGIYGDVRDYTIEIGNEYYGKQSTYSIQRFSADLYGEIAGKFSAVIEEVSDGRASIGVQIGRKAHENAAIIENFDLFSNDVDIQYLVAHAYPWTESSVAAKLQGISDAGDEWARIGIDAPIYLSEWNIGSSSNAATDYRHDYGLAQAAAIVEFIEQMAVQDFAMASTWAVQQRNKTSLFGGEGTDLVKYAGYTFEMLSSRASGAEVLLNAVQLGQASNSVSSWVFDSNESMSIFLSKISGSKSVEISFDQSKLYSDFEVFNLEGITTDGDPTDPGGKAIHWSAGYTVIEFDASTIDIEFNIDHELKVLDLIRVGETWRSVEGTSGNARLIDHYETEEGLVAELFADYADEFAWDTASRSRDSDQVFKESFYFNDGVEVTEQLADQRSTKSYFDHDDVYDWADIEISANGNFVNYDDGAQLEIIELNGQFAGATLTYGAGSLNGGMHSSLNLPNASGTIFTARLSDGIFAFGSGDIDDGLTGTHMFDTNDEFIWNELSGSLIDGNWQVSTLGGYVDDSEFHDRTTELDLLFDEIIEVVDEAYDIFDFYII